MNGLELSSGQRLPLMGQGTWRVGDDRSRCDEEIAALRLGIDLGLTLIDTAEMYGDGASETLVGQAIAGRRDDVYLISKVLPSNASHDRTKASCEASLRRLKTDRLDLYLLHWRGPVPLRETVAAMAELQREGKIRSWGVSNFDLGDMQELTALPGGWGCATNQVLYNLTRRGIEWDLLPWHQERRIPVMAYSPIEQARVVNDPRLVTFALRYDMTPAQAALAWLLSKPGVMVIPKSSNESRVRENAGAMKIKLTSSQLEELDRLFPAPSSAMPLEML